MYMKKFCIHEIAAINLSKIYFLKNAKKACKPNNHDLHRDWINNKCSIYNKQWLGSKGIVPTSMTMLYNSVQFFTCFYKIVT